MQGLVTLGVGGIAACKDDGGADGTEGGGTGSSSGAPASSSSGGSDGSGSGSTADGSSGEGSTGEPPIVSDCSATTDMTPEQLLAPIEHVIVLMMENRTFDHMFGALALVEGRDVDGLTGTESNPGPDGDVGVYPQADAIVAFDPPHGWNPSHAQWNEGAMDGFVQAYADAGSPMPSEIMGYFDRTTLPISYALADNYALCQRWFASVMGPTWPNRFHLHLGTSNGTKTNDAVTGLPSIFDRLDEAGVSNMYYSSNVPFTLTYGKVQGVAKLQDFLAACADGTLPSFCMVDPIFTNGETVGNDDHPPADVTMGQAFISTVVAAVSASPLWNKCLLVLTYDEHGGFFDHVPPPTTYDELPEFQQLGFRVPAVVIGPHVRRGCAISTVFDHVSILSTVTKRWSLVPLNDRVAMTSDLSSCIDPSFVDDPQPPASLPTMVVDAPRVHHPGARFPGQQELFELADRMALPPEIDRRANAQETMDAVLAEGERLGVLVVRR